MYNILIACDNDYYHKWAINCLKTIQQQNPWIALHVVIINPESNIDKIKNVNYHFEYINFPNDDCKVAYYQALRFLKVSDLFPNDELVMTIDCDTVCARPFGIEEFSNICKTIHVQRHQKADKWMAGLVTYGNDPAFRNDLKSNLMSEPIENWRYGRDQEILNSMAQKYNFRKLYVGEWMSFGKGKGIFITLKGTQKTKDKFLKNYTDTIKRHESART
jgi:hypothetical protein